MAFDRLLGTAFRQPSKATNSAIETKGRQSRKNLWVIEFVISKQELIHLCLTILTISKSVAKHRKILRNSRTNFLFNYRCERSVGPFGNGSAAVPHRRPQLNWLVCADSDESFQSLLRIRYQNNGREEWRVGSVRVRWHMPNDIRTRFEWSLSLTIRTLIAIQSVDQRFCIQLIGQTNGLVKNGFGTEWSDRTDSMR